MKVVIDTNVIISALAHGGKPFIILSMARKAEIELVFSSFLFDEIRRILQDKFFWTSERAERIIFRLRRIAIIVSPKKTVKILEDDPDNRVLECAAEGGAKVIITGDRAILRLKEYQGIMIMGPAEFLEKIDEMKIHQK